MDASDGRLDRATDEETEEGVMGELSALVEAPELDSLVQSVISSTKANAAFSAFPRLKEIVSMSKEPNACHCWIPDWLRHS